MSYDKLDKEATREAKALNWMKKNVKSKIPKKHSKVLGIRGSQFWRAR